MFFFICNYVFSARTYIYIYIWMHTHMHLFADDVQLYAAQGACLKLCQPYIFWFDTLLIAKGRYF